MSCKGYLMFWLLVTAICCETSTILKSTTKAKSTGGTRPRLHYNTIYSYHENLSQNNSYKGEENLTATTNRSQTVQTTSVMTSRERSFIVTIPKNPRQNPSNNLTPIRLKVGNFSINCSVSYSQQVILKNFNMTAFNRSYTEKCLTSEDPPWWDDPRIYFIGGGSIGGLILMGICKGICGYCSKYCETYYPPHYKAPRRKRGKNGWTLRQIDKMPVITDVPPPCLHGPSVFV